MYDETIRNLRNESKYALPSQTRKALIEAADVIEKLEITIAGLNEVIKGLADDMPRWIPVTERLPETGVDVLVMFPQNMAVASRDMGEWVVNSGDGWCTDVNLSDDEKEPTHWMPLPEPPKEET